MLKNLKFKSGFSFYILKLPFLNMLCDLQIRPGYYTELHLSIYFCSLTWMWSETFYSDIHIIV